MNTQNNNHPIGDKAHLYEIKKHADKERVCKPEAEYKDLHRMDLQMRKALEERSEHCAEELLAGFNAIAEYPRTVTIFGSARTKEDDPVYQNTRRIAGKIAEEGFAVLTGGGPGVMEAANRGAFEAVGSSIGFNINLPFEQSINPYVTHGLDFDFFSARKMAMFFSAEAYLYFPGGFGTLDEFFQLVTLIQTGKAPKTPIILVGTEFWNPLQTFIEETLRDKFGTISPEDIHLYTITDDDDKILEIVRNAPDRGHYE